MSQRQPSSFKYIRPALSLIIKLLRGCGCFWIFERPRIKRHNLHCEGSQWPNHHVRIQLYLFIPSDDIGV